MSETTEITLPEEVTELLEPIDGDSPVGVDANTVDEYFKLDMEIGKISPDYKLCVELSTIILSEKSKDLWVASWLCFAWFRLDGIEGFKNGLTLIINLLQKFGEEIHPQKPNYRSKAVQFINSGRFYKLLEKEEIKNTNAQITLDAENVFNDLVKECSKQFPKNIPVLKAVENVIKELCEKANEFVKQGNDTNKTEQPVEAKPKDESVIKESSPKDEQKNDAVEVVNEEKPESPKPVQPVISKTEKDTSPLSDKTAVASIRSAIKYFFEENDDTKKLKVPTDSSVYVLSRNLVWGKFKLPPNKDNITQIDPPNSVIQQKIIEWFSANDWDVLIPRIELNFLNTDSGFLYWLDVQRYVVKALEQKGGKYKKTAGEIKISLALFLQKFPQIIDLKFKNKETAFADKETIQWISSDVYTILGSSENSKEPLLLPPIMGEDYNSINEEYQKACRELPNNFEENVAKIQQQISGDTRRKGRFLRQLNLANLCVEAKQYQLAKVHLLQLNEKIEEYNLAEWEPALCVAVWQSTYLVNNNLVETKDKDTKNLIELEQAKLFSKIANYDGVLAIKLSNKN